MSSLDRTLLDAMRCASCHEGALEPATPEGRGGKNGANGAGLSCGDCGAVWRVDKHGILHLTEDDFYYREVDRAFFDGIDDVGSPQELATWFDGRLDTLPAGRRDYLLAYALGPNRGGVAALGNTGPGTVSLDFGSGWGNLTRGIAACGGAVVSVDMTYESLLFSRWFVPPRDGLFVRAGQQFPLPFADGGFDTVFLNGVLEWIPEGWMVELSPKEVQRLYLEEFRRVLKPGGTIVVGIENRHSMNYWVGRKDDHTGLRFGALLPRPVANVVSKRVRGRPYRTYTHTHGAYRRLFRGAGFAKPVFHTPWPRYRDWDRLVPLTSLPGEDLAPVRTGDSWKARTARRVFGAARKAGALGHFVPDYYIVAGDGAEGKGMTPEAAGPLLMRIQRLLGEKDSLDGAPIIRASTTHTLHVALKDWFVKVPLTHQAQLRIRREMEALQALSGSALDAYVLQGARLVEEDALSFGAYPLLDEVEVVDRVADPEPFRMLWQTWTRQDANLPLGDTDTARRLQAGAAGRIVGWPAALGTEWLGTVSDRKVPTGVVHGDLTPGNIVRARRHAETRTRPNASSAKQLLLDWDRYEANGPRVLDAMHLLVHERQQQGMSWARALEGLAPDAMVAMGGPTLQALLGELTWPEARMLYVLDRVEKDLDAFGDPRFVTDRWRAHALQAAAAVIP